MNPASTQAPPSSPSAVDLVETFTARLEAADGRVHFCRDAKAAHEVLRALVRAEPDGRNGFVDPAAELLVTGLTNTADLRLLAPETPPVALAGASLVVTGAAALIAETGTILLLAGPTPVRTASILARRHVVVARAASVVPDLAAAFERHPPGKDASWACLVTGPSRTADIEKRLVLGAHGPLALDVLLLGA